MNPSNPTSQTLSPPAGQRIAPLPRRLLAAVTDIVLVGCLAIAVGLTRVDLVTGGSLSDLITASLELAATASLVAVIVGLAHEIIGVAVWGRTLGKWAFGLRVRRSNDHRAVGWYSAAMRAGVPFAAGLAPMVGQIAPALVYGWLLRDQEQRQGLHDKAADTVVVMAS